VEIHIITLAEVYMLQTVTETMEEDYAEWCSHKKETLVWLEATHGRLKRAGQALHRIPEEQSNGWLIEQGLTSDKTHYRSYWVEIE